MATAHKLPSGSWRCQVFDHKTPDGKIISKSFTVKDPSKAGKRKCEALAADWARDKGRVIPSTSITFEQAAEQYILSRSAVLSPTTIDGYRTMLRHHYGQVMAKYIDTITKADVQALVNAVSRNHSPKTVRNVYSLFCAVMRENGQDMVLRAKIPEKRPSVRLVPSEADAKAIIEAVRGTALELPVLLATFGPMRRGEICALRTANIRGRVVHVCENMVKDQSSGHVEWVIKAPKSAAGDRLIEYPDQVARLWQDKDGRITNMNPDTLTNEFRRTLIRKKLPVIRFHDLRHFSASIQHAIGIPDAYIMARGGWGDDRTLKEIYRHTVTGPAKEMSDKVNSYFDTV